MHTTPRRLLLSSATSAVVAGLATPRPAALAAAADWPERPVRLVTPAAPGGALDLAARLFAERLAARWGQPVLVDNRPGADGILAVEALLGARDGGHTLLFAFPGIVTVVPLLRERLPYNPAEDLAPIAAAAHDVLAVFAAPSLPAGSLADLTAFARTRPPGTLNWAAAPGAPYLTFLAFQRRAGVEMTHVGYRGSNAALPDLTAGRVHVLVTPLAPGLPLAREGKVRLLAVSTPERAAAAPEIPTVAEAGHPELTVEAPIGLFASRTTLLELRERIAEDLRAVAADPAVAERLRGAGLEVRGEARTPAAYAATLAAQRARWADLARLHGARPRAAP
ncbi:Bug family tripartite tricarboxylate transporter substrate binding protein [Siccirubricoccus deserti]|uniref:Tripartite tricarboxylate transporter substrate binding protein n=1 Tax=Siccirubricoccus deserti TaxID=2013562 RepID=A0A9X0R2B6_9PROT|nr:tripartite tricarboxylate transporter substrate binding protein [Siccirubricoccus deserti]MBC4018275.1 tripartite tricarboxylate transporter substrate binding protein [Siccirubricoccus deserti]